MRRRWRIDEIQCERRNGRWYWDSGYGGFGGDTPEDILDTARALGWL
jgi:hypothetical protein